MNIRFFSSIFVGTIAVVPALGATPPQYSQSTTGGISGQPVLADFNNDGHLDIAATGGEDGDDLAVLRGDGCGNFEQTQVINIFGSDPLGKSIGDWNSDGQPDLAILQPTEIILFAGDGEGSFNKSSTSFTISGSRLVHIITADLNLDNVDDFVVVNRNLDQTHVFLGLGNGQFAERIDLAVGEEPYRTVVADFNSDGNPDIATSSFQSNNIMIHYGQGDGSFPSSLAISTGESAVGLAADDFNNDGRTDIAVGLEDNPSLAIYHGQAQGSFILAETISLGDHTEFFDVIVFDENSDGHADLLVTEDPFITVLAGDASGTFEIVRQIPAIGLSLRSIFDVAVVDVNLDGQDDIISTSRFNSQLVVRLGDFRGYGITILESIKEPDEAITGLATGDFNQDGLNDVAIKKEQEAFFLVHINEGNGSFADPVESTFSNDLSQMRSVDMNGDGTSDVVAASGQYIVVYPNQDGEFLIRQRSGIAFQIRTYDLGDFNGDGSVDVVAGSGDNLVIAFGDGNGNFTYSSEVDYDSRIESVVALHFDDDNILDLVISLEEFRAGPIKMLKGVGDGTFTIAQEFMLAEDCLHLTAGDIDADGHTDVFAPVPREDLVYIFYGNDQVGLNDPVMLQEGDRPTKVHLADVDRDGRLDRLTWNDRSNTLEWSRNLGSRSFDKPRGYRSLIDGGSRFVTDVEDMDGDGFVDLLYSEGTTDNCAILWNLQTTPASQESLFSLELLAGDLIQGNIDSLRISDDEYLLLNSEFGFLSSQPNVIQFRVVATSMAVAPSSFSTIIEGRLNNPAGTMAVQYKDHTIDSFVPVETYTIGTIEEAFVIASEPAERFIRESDGEIAIDIKQYVVATFSLSGFQSRFDLIEILVR